MGGRKWTDRELKQLADMWREGYTLEEIAEELNRCDKHAVWHKIHRAGLRLEAHPNTGGADPLVRAKVIRMATDGLVAAEIAREKGISPQSVRDMLRKLVRRNILKPASRSRRGIVYVATKRWARGDDV